MQENFFFFLSSGQIWWDGIWLKSAVSTFEFVKDFLLELNYYELPFKCNSVLANVTSIVTQNYYRLFSHTQNKGI